MSTCDFLLRMQLQGLALPPIFAAPGLETNCFKEDWLHTTDLGVTLDYIGNLCWLVLPKLGPDNRKGQPKALFLEIRAWYKENRISSRLDHLTDTMVKKKSGKACKTSKSD